MSKTKAKQYEKQPNRGLVRFARDGGGWGWSRRQVSVTGEVTVVDSGRKRRKVHQKAEASRQDKCNDHKGPLRKVGPWWGTIFVIPSTLF